MEYVIVTGMSGAGKTTALKTLEDMGFYCVDNLPPMLIPNMAKLCLERGALDVLISDTQERDESIWTARGAFLEAIKGSTESMDECDVVVPRDRIAAFVKKSVEIGKEMQVRICSFGHAGDGNLHIYVCQDGVADEQWHETVEKVMERLYSEARLLSGERRTWHRPCQTGIFGGKPWPRAGGAHAGHQEGIRPQRDPKSRKSDLILKKHRLWRTMAGAFHTGENALTSFGESDTI